jgi:hypothetical protein
MAQSLPIPPAAKKDQQSLEMIRVWLANGKQHCSLKIGFWEERGIDELQAWGILLADMVHHIANAHEAEYGRDPRESIGLIRETLAIEMNNPTSARLGHFVIKE